MGWILETNEAMNRAMEGMGGKIVRRYRIFEKELDGRPGADEARGLEHGRGPGRVGSPEHPPLPLHCDLDVRRPQSQRGARARPRARRAARCGRSSSARRLLLALPLPRGPVAVAAGGLTASAVLVALARALRAAPAGARSAARRRRSCAARSWARARSWWTCTCSADSSGLRLRTRLEPFARQQVVRERRVDVRQLLRAARCRPSSRRSCATRPGPGSRTAGRASPGTGPGS